MKTSLLIDGGHLRVCAKKAAKNYDNTFIESFSALCFDAAEYKFRVYYYDSPQYRGKVTLPVSGNETNFQSNDAWLNELATRERFAVRRGTLGFRGWKPKNTPIAGAQLTDADFAPIFEQKGVDMRIGLDIATFCENRSIDRVLLVSADTDMIPAMKHARKAGIEIGLIQLGVPAAPLHKTLKAHCDFMRHVALP
ncbi:NYN domain-containing protein [Sphingomonas sp. ASV193]|uniref:NYN domain-containing protein n=1 Tax=Sphingomonas sp. ASV193 TaxID=3144405 RepID=UPI0032E909D1